MSWVVRAAPSRLVSVCQVSRMNLKTILRRLRLITLCIMAIVACVVMMGIYRKYRSIQTIEASGGSIKYDYDCLSTQFGIPMRYLTALDKRLGWPLAGEPSTVYLGTANATTLTTVSRLSTLRSVNSWEDCNASLADFYCLRALGGLEQLTLCAHSEEGDAFLANVSHWPRLQWIMISGCHISDTGIDRLRGHPEIVRVEFYGDNIAITDKAVPALLTIPKLHTVIISDSGLSDAAIDRLTFSGITCVVVDEEAVHFHDAAATTPAPETTQP